MSDGHVAVFSFPFASHPSVLFNLVQKLAAAAPNVRFSFFNTTKSNQMLFSKVKLDGYDNIKPCNVHDGTPEGYVFSGNPLELIDLFIKATPGNFRSSLEEAVKATGLKISCLLADAFLWFSGDIAEEMGIPWVPFWTSGPCSLSIHMCTDAILEELASKGGVQNENRSLELLPGMPAIKVKDVPDEVLHKHQDRPFPNMLYKMGLAVPRATAVVLNSFDEIDPIIVIGELKSRLQKVLNIGPLMLASPQSSQVDESGCLSWLDKQENASVVYISFGTSLTPPPSELLAIAEALESKQIPYLWSFKDDSKQPLLDEFFAKTSSTGKVVPWCPQLQVLAHSAVGAFVTHGGWSSVMESIGGGVSMICRPFFGEQKLNRRLIQDVWQIGVGMEGLIFTKNGMMNALDTIFSRENGNKMRTNIAELRKSGKKAVAENGSSTENFRTLLQIIKSSPDD